MKANYFTTSRLFVDNRIGIKTRPFSSDVNNISFVYPKQVIVVSRDYKRIHVWILLMFGGIYSLYFKAVLRYYRVLQLDYV